MAATLVLGPACTMVLSALQGTAGVLTALQFAGAFTDPASRIVDQMPAIPKYPIVLVESVGEQPFNTLGSPAPSSLGSSARPAVRVISQYRSDAELNAIMSAVRACLDGLKITVGPYGPQLLTWENASPIFKTAPGLIVTREQVSEFDLTVHE